MTEFALVTPDELEQEEPADPIQSRQGLRPRTVGFVIAAVRAASPANFEHGSYSALSGAPPFSVLGIVQRLFVLLRFFLLAKRFHEVLGFFIAAMGTVNHDLFGLVRG